MTRDDYIDVIEHRYFGNMALARPAAILQLLSEDAELTGFHGSDPPRRVRRRPRAGEESFEHFLSALHAQFSLSYAEFVHFVDLPMQRCACTFQLRIAPRSPQSADEARLYRNCNFFQFRGGLIVAVTAYFGSAPHDINPWAAVTAIRG